MSALKTELFRFGVTGCLSTAVNYLVYLLLCAVSLPLYAASAAGYCTGLGISYLLGAKWVFKKDNSKASKISGKTAVRFIVVYGVSGLGMSGIVEGLYQLFELDYRICWLVGAAFAIANNFIGSKFFVFGTGRAV
ncbi:MAG: GtrA family protein [Desulfovibrionaceae bacterium]|nr:GtrA family protein [Desulfovibrionaceae bacterium]